MKRTSISDRDNVEKSFGRIFIELTEFGITATAGGTQAAAYPLNAQTNQISVCATSGDSVMLPPTGVGYEITVINNGAAPLQVYGTGTDTINSAAAATGVSQMPNSVVIYCCGTAGQWATDGLASGYSGSYQTQSVKNGITAHAGGTQAGAIGDVNSQLPAMINRVTVCATGGDSTVLPLAVPGMVITVTNAGAASMNVFPFTGDQINGAGANTAFAVAAGKTSQFTSAVALTWHALLSA
jgi:hypothetical protein